MNRKEKEAVPVSSVGADGKQPLNKSKESIADLPQKGNLQATNLLRVCEKNQMEELQTISMTELYDRKSTR